MASRQEWRELLQEYEAQVRRRAQGSELCEISSPNAGASEEQLLAAEERLGFRLSEDHRTLLSVANGWEGFDIAQTLLSAEELGGNSDWGALTTFFDEGDWLSDQLGVEKYWPHFLQVVTYLDGWSGECFMFTEAGGQQQAGAVFEMGDLDMVDGGIYPNFFDLMSAKLASFREFVDWDIQGDHARTWGRDIRADPPTITQILDKIDELWAQAGRDDVVGRQPGASAAQLATLEQLLGHELAPAHREVLETADGLDLHRTHVLSVYEIADDAGWREHKRAAVETEVARVVWVRQNAGGTVDEAEANREITERSELIPAVPFCYWRAQVPQAYWPVSSETPMSYEVHGVDKRDGAVRNLVTDGTITPPQSQYTPSRGDAREYLLGIADDAYWHAESVKNLRREE